MNQKQGENNTNVVSTKKKKKRSSQERAWLMDGAWKEGFD